jgi:hypothetical protein
MINEWDDTGCEVEGVKEELSGQYNSSYDKDLDLSLKVEKKKITDKQIENGFIIWIEWAKPSKRLLKTFKKELEDNNIEVLDAEEYMESLNELGYVTDIPAFVKDDVVVNGYFKVRDYLKGTY